MPFCKSCGKPIDVSAAACPYCGSPTRAFVQVGGMPMGVPQTPPIMGGSGTVMANPAFGQGGQRPRGPIAPGTVLSFTFIEGDQVLAQTDVALDRDQSITFGRQGCDVNVQPASGTVSGRHGLIAVRGGQCFVQDAHSRNGIFLNGVRQTLCRVIPGDVITIGAPRVGQTRTVIVVADSSMSWTTTDLKQLSQMSIGRLPGNDLVIPNPTVSAQHALLMRGPAGWAISDMGSSNGTQVNGRFIPRGQQMPLSSGSMINLGNAQIIFLDTCLLVFGERQGVDVTCENLVRYRKNKGKTIITTDHISLHIKRGEFVAIVGGSGSGKSTILNELNGSEPADEGSVAIDGTDLYANYEMLKTSIGYVPQQDIVYDNLTLESMLKSAAKLRMTPDSTKEERTARVDEIINLLELDGVRHNMIGRLSGGQKKRASIAVELLADPRLLFLDEPTSGLDPGIERKLMQTLAQMARDGRTIILVTHTTLNLHLCDQVVFLGYGGKLAYAGRPSEAKTFFNVTDFVDIYNKINDDPDGWQRRFLSYRAQKMQAPAMPPTKQAEASRKLPSLFSQFVTLSGRYTRLIINDHARLFLLLVQGPLLATIISLVGSKDCFNIYENSKTCMFALACAAFWVGIFSSIQEVCKERDIFKREYEGGVRLGAYVASKVVVLGGLCLLQTVMLTGGFLLVTQLAGKAGGAPGEGCILPWASFEMFIAMTLLTLSAMCLGLLVSAIFKNPDGAIALAPMLFMPQILFAGVVFELEPGTITNYISYGINCRWGIEALGTSLDLDTMDLAMYGDEITVPADDYKVKDIKVEPDEIGEIEVEVYGQKQKVKPKDPITIDEKTVHVDKKKKKVTKKMLKHDPEDLDHNMFTRDKGHLLRAWGILVGFCFLCVVGCHVLLWLSVRR